MNLLNICIEIKDQFLMFYCQSDMSTLDNVLSSKFTLSLHFILFHLNYPNCQLLYSKNKIAGTFVVESWQKVI